MFPGRYAGGVLLFRPKTRPLFHGLTPDLNWGQVVTGGVEVITVPGDHDTILQKPNADVLAERLQALLDKELDRRNAAWSRSKRAVIPSRPERRGIWLTACSSTICR